MCPAVPSLLRAGPPGTSQMALWKGFLGPPVGSAGGRRVCRRPLSQLPTLASRGRLVDGAAGLPSAGASRCGVSRRRPLPGDSAVLSLSRGEDSAGGCEVACRCHRRVRCRSRLPARSLGPVLGAGEGEPLALSLTPGAARCGPGQASCVPPSPGLRNGRGTPLPGPWAGSGTGTQKGLGAKAAVGAARGSEWSRLCPQPLRDPRVYVLTTRLGPSIRRPRTGGWTRRRGFSPSAGARRRDPRCHPRPKALEEPPPCLLLLLSSLSLGLWPPHPRLCFPVASALPSGRLSEGRPTAYLGPCEIQREILVSRSFIRSAETSSSSK